MKKLIPKQGNHRTNKRLASTLLLKGVFCLLAFEISVYSQKPIENSISLQENLAENLLSGDSDQRQDALVRLGAWLSDSNNRLSEKTFLIVGKILQGDSSAVSRAMAARVFEANHDNQSIPLLLESLGKEKEVGVQKAIIYALSQYSSPSILTSLISLLKNKKSEIRAAAAYALAEIGDQSTSPALIGLLKERRKDEDAFARAQAVRGLSKSGNDNVVEILLNTFLRDDSAQVRRAAANALGETAQQRDVKVIEALREALLADDPYLVAAARNALDKIISPKP